MNLRKYYFLMLLCLPCFVQAKNITITRLTCEMQEGLVVVEGTPRLGWVMESPENGTRQSAYEIDIQEAFTGRSIWNSGKVNSSQSQLVPIKGANIIHTIIFGVYVFGMKPAILLNGALKRSFVPLPKRSLKANGLERLPVKMHTFRKDANFTAAS